MQLLADLSLGVNLVYGTTHARKDPQPTSLLLSFVWLHACNCSWCRLRACTKGKGMARAHEQSSHAYGTSMRVCQLYGQMHRRNAHGWGTAEGARTRQHQDGQRNMPSTIRVHIGYCDGACKRLAVFGGSPWLSLLVSSRGQAHLMRCCRLCSTVVMYMVGCVLPWPM